MKSFFRTFYLSFAILLSFENYLAQSFIDTTKVWHVGQWSGFSPNSCYTQIYQFKEDSVVNNQKYTVLKVSSDSALVNWYTVGLFREDTILKRVFWLLNNVDELLYDFSLEVGDTAKVTSTFGNPYPNCGTEMIVDSIAFHEYFGTLRKHWYFNTPYYNNPETWVEGIGNLFGPIDNKVFTCTADYLPDLLCYSKNSELSWINQQYQDCYINTMGFDDSFTSFQMSLSPNPIVNEFQVLTNSYEKKQMKVVNAQGVPVYFEVFYSLNSGVLQLKEPGSYFIQIETEKSIYISKLVKL
ncbi:MAG: T9SS type A sorting domain-containing protein [Crocinitomicaceae bacterium]